MTKNEHIKIIVVEDDVIIAENLKWTLLELGYDVVDVCNNYQETINSIKENDFDLLILDINLGSYENESGIDIARALPDIKEIPFIFLTAYSDKDTIREANALNPSAYLVKPTNEGTLFACIQMAIENFNNHKKPINPEKKNQKSEFFYTKIGTSVHKVFWADVICIKSIKNYIEIYIKERQNCYLIRTSLKQCLEEMMPHKIQKSFISINRSTVIKIDCITLLEENVVKTQCGEFEISKNFYKKINNAILKNNK